MVPSVEADAKQHAQQSSDTTFLIGQSVASEPKLATALEEYKKPAVRSEAPKEAPEDQTQKVAAAETESQQAQQTASQCGAGSEGARRRRERS